MIRMREFNRPGDMSVRHQFHLSALVHPGFLTCLLLFGLNDHLWKRRYPGFLTGKLSDFVGVVVFSLVVAALASRVTSLHRAWNFAVVTTTALMIAVKTSQLGADTVAGWMSIIVPSRIIADPWDLLGLTTLPVSRWIWFEASTVDANLIRGIYRRATRPAMLGVALFFCAATSQPEELRVPEIAPHFSVDQGVIRVLINGADEQNANRALNANSTPIPSLNDVVIRESRDGGKTWTVPTNQLVVPASTREFGTTCTASNRGKCYSIDPVYSSGFPTRTALFEHVNGAKTEVWSRLLDQRYSERARRDDLVDFSDPDKSLGPAYLSDVIQLPSGEPLALMWPDGVVARNAGVWRAQTFEDTQLKPRRVPIDGTEYAYILIPSLVLSFFATIRAVIGKPNWVMIVVPLLVGFAGLASLVGLVSGEFIVPLALIAALGCIAFGLYNSVVTALWSRLRLVAALPVLGVLLSYGLWLRWAAGAATYGQTSLWVTVLMLSSHTVAAINLCLKPKPVETFP
jgi:hypothetical protein